MSGEIDAGARLEVTLTAKQWNNLLTLANEGLVALAALLTEIQRQCMNQGSVVERMPTNAEMQNVTYTHGR